MPEEAIKLSLLDFNWVSPEASAAQSLRDTFAAAKRAEALGFTRYWVGEHHLEGHASGSPQLLAAILGTATRRIRVGIGAMLLPYWSPLKLAEDFRLLETIFGRVDLGVGRGRADNERSHLALLDGRPGGDGMLGEDEYRRKIEDLLGFLRHAIPEGHPHHGAAVLPELDVSPEVWVCGGEGGATQAARLGTRFSCTLFHGRIVAPVHLARYRAEFKPVSGLDGPYAMIAVCGTCADTDAEALAIREQFPHKNYLPSVFGSPATCRSRIADLSAEYGVDEIMILDMAPTGAHRIRSMELLAEAFALGGKPARADEAPLAHRAP